MALSKAEAKQKFESHFVALVDELVEYLQSIKIPGEAVQWYKQSLLHNTIGGKLNRGLSVLDTYSILTGTRAPDDAAYKRAAVLGWSVELLQAYFLIADDIMDDSKTRRGQPCWYLMEGVGNIAINDAFMIESAIYYFLRKYFRSEPYYVDIMDLMHEVTFQTELGQQLDLLIAPETHVDLDKFSLDKHEFIITYKTAFYSFYLPVALAMYMAGVSDGKDFEAAKRVLIALGQYFQVQDDFLDCYGDPEVIGKIGTDIYDNKCSWMINMALKKANADQRAILDANYGRKTAENEKAVKAVYDALDLKHEYEVYEETIVGQIRSMIAEIDESRGFKRQVLTEFLNKIYKRSK